PRACRGAGRRVPPLGAVDPPPMTTPPAPPDTGRLRLLTAGVATPGGSGAWAGVPLWLDRPPPRAAGSAPASAAGTLTAVTGAAGKSAAGTPAVAIVPTGFGYA